MSGRHGSPGTGHLFVPGASVVHRTAAEAKIVSLVAFVAVVALTPRFEVGVVAAQAAVLLVVIVVSDLPWRVVAGRLLIVSPVVAFALVPPLVGGGASIDVAGLRLSVDGLWGSWNVVSKAVLGATASIVLAATTPISDLVRGLARLRVPDVVVSIVAVMVRYVDVLLDQLHRMRTAMVARAHDPRWLWQARPLASATGALFVRSYERGERIHLAMAARGSTGTLPDLGGVRPAGRDWVRAGIPPGLAGLALVLGIAVR